MSEKQNFCIVKKNKFYAELYEMLEDEDLFMQKPEHTNQILFKIKKFIEKSKIFTISKSFDKKIIAEEMLVSIVENNENKDSIQGHTLFVFADDESMYEVFFMEDLINKPTDEDINEFSSISNVLIQPILWDTTFVKTTYKDSKLEGVNIDKDDIYKILLENFYHNGVMINIDGSFQDIQFSGENPFFVIGNFKVLGNANILGFELVFYNEDSDHKNENASLLYGETIKGRLFVVLLSPISNKKLWSIKTTTIKNMLSVLKNPNKVKKISDEIELNEKYVNPFFILKNNL